MRSVTLRIGLLLIAASLTASCGWPDAYSSMPESLRLPKAEPRAPDPEPQVASLLQANPRSVFVESASPTNVMFTMPWRDPESYGWIFCIKADVNGVTGAPIGTQTYLVHVEQGNIGRRQPAETKDGCDSGPYHRLSNRAAITSTTKPSAK
jgi:hypothetical protein